MALGHFSVMTGGHWEDGVRIDYQDGPLRCFAIFQWATLDEAFDPLLKLGPPHRRLHPHEWNILAAENLPAFGRIIAIRHERDRAATGTPLGRVEVSLSDIQGSVEVFTRDSLPINTAKEWSRGDFDLLAYELRRDTPLLKIAEDLKREVIEVETMADRIEIPG